jgi:hypothetical protein
MQFERLSEKYNSAIPPARLMTLNHKRDAGTITLEDLPATLRREWPGSIPSDMPLDGIRSLCERRSSGGSRR